MLPKILLLLFLLYNSESTILEDIVNSLSSVQNKTDKYIYTHLFYHIQVEQEFNTCLIMGSKEDLQQQFVQKLLMRQFNKPLLVYDQKTVHKTVLHFNKDILFVVQLNQTDSSFILRTVAANLKNLVEIRVVFIWTCEIDKAAEADALRGLFMACWEYRLLNTVAIFRDFAETQTFYSYTRFPQFKVEFKKLVSSGKVAVFPQRMRNLQGHTIRTTLYDISPKTGFKINMVGGQRIAYYPIRLLELLVIKLNATLSLFHVDEHSTELYLNDLWLTRNNSVDVSSNPAIVDHAFNYDEYSYPIEMARRCVILPTGGKYVYLDFFTKFLNPLRQLQVATVAIILAILLNLSRIMAYLKKHKHLPLRLVDFYLNWMVFAGFLGLSFPIPAKLTLTQRIVITSISFSGLMFSTSILARVNAFLNTPPTEQLPLTMDKIAASQVRIIVSRQEYEELVHDTLHEFHKYARAFKVVHSLADFPPILDTIDTRYAYAITSSMWPAAASFHRLYTRTLLRPARVCLKPLIFLSFPLQSNSIYKEPLKHIILKVQDMGLLQLWAGEILHDFSAHSWLKPRHVTWSAGVQRVLSLKYFSLAWYLFAFSFSLSTAVFCWELLYFKKLRHLHMRRRLLKVLWNIWNDEMQ